MNPIQVKTLRKDYGHHRGVFDISFEVNKGECFGFLGPNGAGKSTTIRHIMGFSKGDKGETKIFDLNSFKYYSTVLDNVGYLPGEIALPDGLNGKEFLEMMENLRHKNCKENIDRLVKLFQLDLSINVKRMSLGEKRKLAIIACFMHDPEIIVLDEPTSGLDIVMQEIFINLIKEEKRKGKTILFSSHIFSEVDESCDRIAIIKDGEIVSLFKIEELHHKENKNYEITFSDNLSFFNFLTKNRLSLDFKIYDVLKDELKIKVNIDDSNINILIKELSNYNLVRFHHLKETLEQYFMSYYKEEGYE